MRFAFFLVFFTWLSACARPVSPEEDPPCVVTMPTAPMPPGPDPRLQDYAPDVRAAGMTIGVSADWADWMIARKDRWAYAYLIGRDAKTEWRVDVRYENPIAYDPPWASEAEHFAALKRLAELQYPGWTFTFSAGDAGADVTLYLGHRGYSEAYGKTMKLFWEGIFSHEFGHTLGLRHHYCGNDPNPCPDEEPPGEGECIMSRDRPFWGPTETFLLRLGPPNDEVIIDEAIDALNHRYPADWAT